LDLASALLKQIIVTQDIATWTLLRKNYLPPEYFALHERIASFVDRFTKVPTFEELKFDAKGKQLQQKIAVVELVEVEAEPGLLLEFLKSDYAQQLTIDGIDKLLDKSVAFESPTDSIEALQSIAQNIEEKIDIEDGGESMQRIELFESEEAMSRRVTLGLNTEYDANIQFGQEDLVLLGGRRGAGKSLVCANLVANSYEKGASALYFTIEMNQRETLQRIASISAGVSHYRLKNRTLHPDELQRLAKWWSARFIDGEEFYAENYDLTVSFDDYHDKLSKLPLKDARFDIIFAPQLSIPKLQSELERKIPILRPDKIIVDYLNKVQLHNTPSKRGQFDWTEQIEVADKLKKLAQKYKVPIFAPYQTDASGEARFAKGILDAADAAFALNAHTKDDNAITFDCTKMRGNDEVSFTSVMDWENFKLGPDTAIVKVKEEDSEDVDDLDSPF
tara:strand:- start:72510 stop:73853 length:1344 start_codon:yes stop_codon:yes gene_type:complete